MKIAFSQSLVPHRAAAGGRRGERGVALVITLILLSVTLVMAVAFLALSRREREANATTTDATQARLAAQSALDAATAQIVANIYSTNAAAYNFGLLVSTNYINTNGYSTTDPNDPLNVSYVYLNTLNPLTGADLAQSIANLKILPRAPVFIPTNGLGNDDFRFYLDLNRNGQYDPNGFVATYTNFNGAPVYAGNAFEVGDPEWVGVLERPDQMHSPVNRFVSRYAFFAMPVGNSLDINAIHNQARSQALSSGNDGYVRDQGLGSWELNLAGFFADLNTNIWSASPLPNSLYYNYGGNSGAVNYGIAFNDALSVLAYRYNNNYTTLSNAASLYGFTANPFIGEGIDLYDNFAVLNNTLLNEPWVGADNVNHFFSLPDELFNTNEVGIPFVNRLTSAGTNADTYSRYSFYRMLAQLGTDSSAESGKLNLNYMNVDTNSGNIIPGMETNLVRWPNGLTFFTNAADRMLRLYTTNWLNANPSNFVATYYGYTGYVSPNYIATYGYGFTNAIAYGITNEPGFGIGNIPVYYNGNYVYASSANRLLQLAANLYDASNTNFFPSVYRPLLSFDRGGYGTNLFVSGYTNIASNPFTLPVDILTLEATNRPFTNQLVNVYGVPWILGAKKYMPNLNQLDTFGQFDVTRKIQIYSNNVSMRIATNEMYVLAITNTVGCSFWNSYSNAYPRPLTLYALDNMQMSLYDPLGNQTYPLTSAGLSSTIFTNGVAGYMWPGKAYVPFSWNNPFITPCIYSVNQGRFIAGTNTFDADNVLTSLPQFILNTTNYFWAYILDGTNVVDYVQLRGPISSRNLANELSNPDENDASGYGLWLTNTAGAMNQIYLSMGAFTPNQVPTVDGGASMWTVGNPPGTSGLDTQPEQQAYFQAYVTANHIANASAYGSSPSATETNNDFTIPDQAPYSPTRMTYQYDTWQANDPLVHYLAQDLVFTGQSTNIWGHQDNPAMGLTLSPPWNLAGPSVRYQPWGAGVPTALQSAGNYDFGNTYNLMYKDPLVYYPDCWDFPTNLYPTVGWIGRVHRGTPWQTVYLKASDILHDPFINPLTRTTVGTNTWAAWAGGLTTYDSADEAPVQDHLLFDVFTTQLNDNASHGTLSVNQKNFAAWSALFSGMAAVMNTTPSIKILSSNTVVTTATTNISPAGVAGQNSALWQIYTNINATRGNPVLFTNGVFNHVGDILSAPTLTERSPFINTNTKGTQSQMNFGISDEVYEWLPQEAMSLLRVSESPRYVIYGYGQALRPAANGTYNAGAGPLFNLVTNYQVVAETGVRAVVQVHPQVTATATGFVTNYTTTVESFNLLPPH